jgi:hypothetical protein
MKVDKKIQNKYCLISLYHSYLPKTHAHVYDRVAIISHD